MSLRYDLQPMHDFELSKRLRWDPQEIDFSQDAKDWKNLSDEEQEMLLASLSMFIAGEEAVASDLAPLLWALHCLGGLREEELFVTSQILDESIHVEFFHRWFDQVAGRVDHSRYWGPSYRALFYTELPQALEALLTDQSPRAMARALTTYHITVEGMLAETGYHGIFLSSQRHGVLPGLQQGMTFVKRDESRHIAYGIYALQRLLRQEPALWGYINETLDQLVTLTMGVIAESMTPYGENPPFGLRLDELVEYASDQFSKRHEALERALPSPHLTSA